MAKLKDISSYACDYLKLVRSHKSKSTAETFRRVLARFCEIFGDKKPDEITVSDTNKAFPKYLVNSYRLSDITVYQYMQILRYFFEYLHEHKVPALSPKQIDDKKMYKNMKEYVFSYHGDYLNSQEKEKILAYWRESAERQNPRGLRNQIIIKILSTLGLTVTEFTYLDREDVDLIHRQLRIRYKDSSGPKRSRVVPLDSETSMLLSKYLEIRNDKCQCLVVAFRVSNAYVVDAWPLTPRSIERIIHNTASDLKIAKAVTPSTFRNTLIREMDDKRCGKDSINSLLGLSDTSMRYTYFRK